MSRPTSRPHELLWRFAQLQRGQRLPPVELRARQWTRLRLILAHAYEQSTHYRRVFDALGARPQDVRSPADLAALPLLRRADLRRADDLLAQGFRRDRLHTSFSSGSTGEGVAAFFDPAGWVLARLLLKLRARLACGLRPWDRIAQFQWIPHADSALRRHLLRQRAFGVDRAMDEVLHEAARYAPSVLYGFPGYLRKLGAAAGHTLDARLIFTSGEMLTLETRSAIGQAFGGAVYDIYGCTEMKEIAWECPARSGYHINADWLYVEILDDTQTEAPPGSIVVTSLYNRAMPLIRYLVGDLGRFRDGPCPCGRTLPLMAPEVGRQVDYIVLPDGGELSPYTVLEPVEAFPGVAQYEIVQNREREVAIRIVPGPGWTGSSGGALRARMASLLRGLSVEILTVNEIEPESGGKYRIVRSHADPGDATRHPRGR